MEMPKPGAEHKQLEAMVGTWAGEEKIFPSAWDAKGGSATGQITARLSLDGFFIVADYVEERGGKTSYRGHGVYGWDAKRKAHTMHWFDSMGGDPGAPAYGKFEGQHLTFEMSEPERGHHRYAYDFSGPGFYLFSISTSPDGKDWKPMMEAKFTRTDR